MNFLTAIFYGIVQGLTEFLPISSSGHLAALQNIFHTENLETSYFTFDILLHLGTLAAVVIVYYKDIWELIKSFFTLCGKILKGKFRYSSLEWNEKFVIFLLIALVPLVVGVFVKDWLEVVYGYTWLIGILWILNGAILLLSDCLYTGKTDLGNMKPKNALYIGLCQLFAILPGISRSGMTITGGLFNGLNREFAVKFSFILSIPAILGANLVSMFELADHPFAMTEFPMYLAGMAAALVAGICAIKLLNFITKKHSFKGFSYYCFAIGVFALVYGLFHL